MAAVAIAVDEVEAFRHAMDRGQTRGLLRLMSATSRRLRTAASEEHHCCANKELPPRVAGFILQIALRDRGSVWPTTVALRGLGQMSGRPCRV